MSGLSSRECEFCSESISYRQDARGCKLCTDCLQSEFEAQLLDVHYHLREAYRDLVGEERYQAALDEGDSDEF